MTTKQNIVHHVSDTAMHLLHDSYLRGSNLWPNKGFRAGWGSGCKLKDCIYVGVNAYGWEKITIEGILQFNILNTGVRRKKQQTNHIKIVLEYAYINDILFENHFKSKLMSDECTFKFTYTPPQQ